MAIDVNISTEFIKDTDTPASYAGQATKKLVVKADETGIEFVPDSSGSDTNIMNANLTANANRTQDMNSFSIYFNNGKQFKWLNNVAPTIGEGSFDFQAYGTTSSDIIFRLKNGSSAVKIKVLGDGSTEWLTGSHAFGVPINTQYRLYAYTSNLTAAFRGYHDGNSGIGVIAQADGSGGIGVQANAGGTNGIGVKMFGANYAAVFNGKFLDETQASTPKFPQANVAGEVALLATLTVGQWYYLNNGDGTGTVKVKL